MDAHREAEPSNTSVLSDNSDRSQVSNKDDEENYALRRNLYTCTYEGCGKKFNRPVRLTEHIRSHTNERPFLCTWPTCTKAFLRESHLKAHIKSIHTQIRDHACTHPSGCSKTFTTPTKLRKHLAAHAQQAKYRCTHYPPCTAQFRKHATLQKHVAVLHLQQPPFPCAYTDDGTGERCSRAYNSHGSLEAHVGRVHGGVQHRCTLCDGVGFPRYAALQEHLRAAHPPTCGLCGAQCPTSRDLRRHVDMQHQAAAANADAAADPAATAKLKFPCSVADCGRSFAKKGNREQHVRTVHQGQRRWVCGKGIVGETRDEGVKGWDGGNACGRGFGTKGNLEEHVRTVHLGLGGGRKARRRRGAGATEVEMGEADADADGGAGVEEEGADAAESGEGGKGAKSVPTLTRLTGHDYMPASGRTIPCLFPARCGHLFHREHDLVLHMKARHGMGKRAVEYALVERNASMGGDFWIGGGGGGVVEEEFGDEHEHERELEWLEEEMEMEVESGGLWGDGRAEDGEGDVDEHERELEWLEQEMEIDRGGFLGEGQAEKVSWSAAGRWAVLA